MIIANKYRLVENIGQGEFGYILKAENIRTREFVALKKEPIQKGLKLLKNETKIYQYLASEKGFPRVLWFGVYEDNYYMALQLLGHSLRIRTAFSLQQIIRITIQMIKRLECLHEKGFIHRDIKPDNFLFGLNENCEELYLIDFGFCKKYLLEDGSHILFRENRPMIGTPNFVSENVRNGYEPSRRDDLESVGNIMYYLLEKNGLIKSNIVQDYIHSCRKIRFDEKPDYDCLIRLLC